MPTLLFMKPILVDGEDGSEETTPSANPVDIGKQLLGEGEKSTTGYPRVHVIYVMIPDTRIYTKVEEYTKHRKYKPLSSSQVTHMSLSDTFKLSSDEDATLEFTRSDLAKAVIKDLFSDRFYILTGEVIATLLNKAFPILQRFEINMGGGYAGIFHYPTPRCDKHFLYPIFRDWRDPLMEPSLFSGESEVATIAERWGPFPNNANLHVWDMDGSVCHQLTDASDDGSGTYKITKVPESGTEGAYTVMATKTLEKSESSSFLERILQEKWLRGDETKNLSFSLKDMQECFALALHCATDSQFVENICRGQNRKFNRECTAHFPRGAGNDECAACCVEAAPEAGEQKTAPEAGEEAKGHSLCCQ